VSTFCKFIYFFVNWLAGRQDVRLVSFVCTVVCLFVWLCFKGLGHAILAKFSTDQMVIELTNI